jgi:hypothetical protein
MSRSSTNIQTTSRGGCRTGSRGHIQVAPVKLIIVKERPAKTIGDFNAKELGEMADRAAELGDLDKAARLYVAACDEVPTNADYKLKRERTRWQRAARNCELNAILIRQGRIPKEL